MPTTVKANAAKILFRDHLRRSPTTAEVELMLGLESDPLLKGRFEFQSIVLGYIPDFASHRDKLLIEVDGAVHRDRNRFRSDCRRDYHLRRNGWRLKRFSNEQIMGRLEDVLGCIKQALSLTY